MFTSEHVRTKLFAARCFDKNSIGRQCTTLHHDGNMASLQLPVLSTTFELSEVKIHCTFGKMIETKLNIWLLFLSVPFRPFLGFGFWRLKFRTRKFTYICYLFASELCYSRAKGVADSYSEFCQSSRLQNQTGESISHNSTGSAFGAQPPHNNKWNGLSHSFLLFYSRFAFVQTPHKMIHWNLETFFSTSVEISKIDSAAPPAAVCTVSIVNMLILSFCFYSSFNWLLQTQALKIVERTQIFDWEKDSGRHKIRTLLCL